MFYAAVVLLNVSSLVALAVLFAPAACVLH
jgi:hypothetical protein